MRYKISHRGNLDGPCKQYENEPSYIDLAKSKGYDVEIDVWYDLKKFEYKLGHDNPEYKISKEWLTERKTWLWCHAKNLEALQQLIRDDMHCFWHQEDQATLTSKNIIWCYPGNFIKDGIAVLPEKIDHKNIFNFTNNILGICTDYPIKFSTTAYNIPCVLNI